MERKTAPSFRKALMERYGTKCYVCGEEGAEYHHLIPLWMGGEDCIENMIPLCHWHHMLMHRATSQRPRGTSGKQGGRPKLALPAEYETILDWYFHSRIGAKECKALLGMAQGTKMTDKDWFRDYMVKHGIVAYRNNVDLIRQKLKKNKDATYDVVGWMKYENGVRQEFHWDDIKGLPISRKVFKV